MRCGWLALRWWRLAASSVLLSRRVPTLVVVAVAVTSCSDPADPLAMLPGQRAYESAQLRRGEQLYSQHCASCHGAGGNGHPDWRQRDAAGRFRPPPLNGTGHTWHHPLAQLRNTISKGGPPGQSAMPAWGAILDDAQINDVIAWFQSQWTDQVYAAWYGIEQRAADGER